MSGATCRVVKLGGSLISFDALAAALQAWYAGQPRLRTLFVVGGGAEVDELRERQRRERHVDDREAHWMAIGAMQENARRLAAVLPEGVETVDAWNFMQADLLGPDPLPESWDVTSDSIAARVAERERAQELVLLKSALPADAGNLSGYVDEYFAHAARSLPQIRLVDLRDPQFAELRITLKHATG